MMDQKQERVEKCIPILAEALQRPIAELEEYWRELRDESKFLQSVNESIRGVPEFSGREFGHPQELRPYRCMLYLFTRAIRPEIFVETGVHNGLGSAFILLGMHRNGTGILHSIDLPPTEQFILAQGNRAMPHESSSGWLIPRYVRDRHRLHIGKAQEELPRLLSELESVDVFLHDSDHSYHHMMFEMGLAWSYVNRGGWLLCDNIEANSAWTDFTAGVGGRPYTVFSFNIPERVWKHGLMRKEADEGRCDNPGRPAG